MSESDTPDTPIPDSQPGTVTQPPVCSMEEILAKLMPKIMAELSRTTTNAQREQLPRPDNRTQTSTREPQPSCSGKRKFESVDNDVDETEHLSYEEKLQLVKELLSDELSDTYTEDKKSLPLSNSTRYDLEACIVSTKQKKSSKTFPRRPNQNVNLYKQYCDDFNVKPPDPPEELPWPCHETTLNKETLQSIQESNRVSLVIDSAMDYLLEAVNMQLQEVFDNMQTDSLTLARQQLSMAVDLLQSGIKAHSDRRKQDTYMALVLELLRRDMILQTVYPIADRHEKSSLRFAPLYVPSADNSPDPQMFPSQGPLIAELVQRSQQVEAATVSDQQRDDDAEQQINEPPFRSIRFVRQSSRQTGFMTPVSKKHAAFVGEPLGEKSVLKVPGIGPKSGGRLAEAGYITARNLIGRYMDSESETAFKVWIQNFTRCNQPNANAAVVACREWTNHHA